jgi:aspartate 1-decarboxylase
LPPCCWNCSNPKSTACASRERTSITSVEGEKVSIVNINNGERLDTYAIPGPAGSGTITLNGPAARKVQAGDLIIVLAYCHVDATEAASHTPILVFPDEQTNLLK